MPVIPLLFILGIGYYYFTISIETKSVSTMERSVEDHGQMIETFLAERKADLEFICSSYDYNELSNPERLQSIFKNLQKNANAFVDLGVFDGNGIHVAYAGPFELKGKEYSEAEWFREVNKKGYYISDVFFRLSQDTSLYYRPSEGKQWEQMGYKGHNRYIYVQ